MAELIDLFLHLDVHLADLVTTYGAWIYAILFVIIFAETGLVVTPILPGDSLLFACGALAATGVLDPWLTAGLLVTAAILGDAVNYAVGRKLARTFIEEGPQTGWLHRLVKREHVLRAHEFFEKHGGKAVVLARFVPIVRTFVPFVAGGARMTYRVFALYNVTGGILWVSLCAGAGYLFGNIPVVKENFELVVIGIIGVSMLPVVFEIFSAWRRTPGSEKRPSI
jgi:membrane-associated protein